MSNDNPSQRPNPRDFELDTLTLDDPEKAMAYWLQVLPDEIIPIICNRIAMHAAAIVQSNELLQEAMKKSSADSELPEIVSAICLESGQKLIGISHIMREYFADKKITTR
jgi:hypothetical protein